MRAVLVGVAAAVLVAALGGVAGGRQDAAKIDAKLLVGKWEPQDEAKKKFTVEFTKDGKLSIAFSGKDDKAVGTYKLDGATLTIQAKLGEKEESMTRTIHSLTKTELVTSKDGGTKETLVRIPGKKGQ